MKQPKPLYSLQIFYVGLFIMVLTYPTSFLKFIVILMISILFIWVSLINIMSEQ